MEVEKDNLQKYFNEKPVNEPSTDFTKLVMKQVEEIAERPVIVKPLISKKGWLLIMVGAFVVVFGSFSLELAGAIRKIPSYFNWENIHLEDFETSIKISVVVVSMLAILTIADIMYRKVKNIA